MRRKNISWEVDSNIVICARKVPFRNIILILSHRVIFAKHFVPMEKLILIAGESATEKGVKKWYTD